MATHRYWRVRVIRTVYGNAPVFISELAFKSAVGGADLTLIGNGGTALSNGVYLGNVPSYGPNNAFDNSTGVFAGSSTAPGTAWFGWDFGDGVTHDIIEVTVTTGAGPNASYCIADGVLEFSDDGATWTPYMTLYGHPAAIGSTTFSQTYIPFGGSTLVAPSGGFTCFGGGNAGLVANPGIVALGGSFAGLLSPAAVVSGYAGALVSLDLPRPRVNSAGHDSTGEWDASLTAPRPELSAFGGGAASISAAPPVTTSTATVTLWGNARLEAPGASLSASGTVSGMGQAALTLSTPYKLVGYSGAVTSITLAGRYTVQAQSTVGSIGGAAITCPLFELTSTATAQNYGSANLLAPAARLGAQAQAWLAAPGFQLTAIGSATITATYEAYAVNLLHRNTDAPVNEATRYTNFPFTHVVRYKNSYYGANSTGLYLLEGTTDDGMAIPWEFKTTITDFESPMGKTAVSAYFAGRMGPEATVGIHLGESGDVSYSHSTPRGPVAQNYRQVFGLGLKARYYALSVAGEGIMELDSVEFNTKTLSRRI